MLRYGLILPGYAVVSVLIPIGDDMVITNPTAHENISNQSTERPLTFLWLEITELLTFPVLIATQVVRQLVAVGR